MTTENSTKPENVVVVNPVEVTSSSQHPDRSNPFGLDVSADESDQDHYERVWNTHLLESKVMESLTPEHVESIANAIPDDQVDMTNLHMPTRQEVTERIVKEVLTSNNVKVIINTVEELEAFEASRQKSEDTGDYTNASIRSFATTKSNVHIAPKLFFDYIKGSLNESEVTALSERLLRFKQIFDITAKSGQLALHENAADNIIRIVKEQEAAACGYKKYVQEKTINTFIKNVEDRAAFFKPFREFPRLIPDDVLEKLTAAQEKNIFEEFWILYLDYSKETIKSNATKVRDKDPILFGKLTKEDTKLFYIACWEDEYCDLTLDKFVTAMQTIDSSYTLPEVKLPKISEIGELLEEKKRRASVLAKTNSSNYREVAEQEATRKAEVPTTQQSSSSIKMKKIGFFRKLFNSF